MWILNVPSDKRSFRLTVWRFDRRLIRDSKNRSRSTTHDNMIACILLNQSQKVMAYSQFASFFWIWSADSRLKWEEMFESKVINLGVSSKVINLDGVWCVPNVGLGCPLSGQSAITSVTVLDRWFLTCGQIWLFDTTYKNQTERSSSEIFRLFLPTFLEFFDIDHLIVTNVIILFQKRPRQ